MDSRLEPRKRLADGNAMFQKSPSATVMPRLAKGQQPFVAVLACSDSRVSPAALFNLSLGEAFVVRVAGNTAADPTVLGSLEYAVSHLNVGAILVLGHTDCGAVKASLGCDSDRGNLEQTMKDMECARSRLPAEKSKDVEAIAESNVLMQMRRIQDMSPVIRDGVRSGTLELIGAMLDIASGRVRFI